MGAFSSSANADDAARAADPALAQRSVDLGVFIRDRRWDDAQALIEALPAEQRAAPDVMFIEAFVSRQRGRPRHAIELYQRLLDDDASLGRVRLELAQTFVEIGDDRAAEQNFRLALATDVRAEIRTNIEAQLTELERRQSWRFSVNLAVAPDSNVNTATEAEQLDLFGLPFELSDEARRTSGVNATLALGAERAFGHSGPLSVLVGVGVRGTDNEGSRFDDAAISGRLGGQFVSMGLRTAVSLVGERRWFGDDWLSTSAGVELSQRFSDGRTVHDIDLQAMRLDYDDRDDRDAWVYGLDWERTQYVSPK